ncbi:MAG: methyl-accepting chemotaxis protein [Syntrophobacteraceae bacterium]
MNWFLNLTTRTKLFMGFGLMVFFLIIVFVTAYTGVAQIRESQIRLFREDFTTATNLISVRSDQNCIRAEMLEMMLVKDRATQQALETDINERQVGVDEGVREISESLKSYPPEFIKFEEMLSILKDFTKTRKELVALVYADKIDEAVKFAVSVQSERYNRMRVITMGLGNEVLARAKERIVQTEKNTNKLVYTFFIIGVLALLLSTGTTLLLNKMIAKPLGEITSAAERISTGDLSTAMRPTERRDEVGSLTNAFAAMTHYLQDIAGISKQVADGNLTVTVKPVSHDDQLGNAIAEMVASLRKINQELRSGVNVLAASAGQILASTTEVASGVTETTTSVTETTATVEEVKQTAQVSAEKSRAVSESAQQAVLIAQQGSAAVEKTVEGINHIRTLMESVAESVVKLSEQTLAIGEIITSVSDLAQQSNLLAVNAAIEASKAGEQGKGFAVVAQEIKALADQSKQATGQVRAILGDIQKATAASVMAAEQVSKAVDGGVKQAAESGEAIRRLAESITESANAATQIAASSQQQFVGIDQISLAMENIKQAAEQNVSGTKQAEQAAYSLNELGQKLKEMVGKYRV